MSCLFRSLGRFVDQGEEALRKEICDFLAQEPLLFSDDNTSTRDIVKWESGSDLHAYIASMRRSSTWGGALEIKAFVELYRMGVRVRDIRTHPNKVIEFVPSRSRPRRWVEVTWSGGHYQPVLPG